MAISLPSIDETIEVISRVDSAISTTPEQYEDYLKTLDESLLQRVDGQEPTRFVLRKVLPTRAVKKLKSDQIGFEEGKPTFRFGSILDDVRYSLIDVKNPPSVPQEQQVSFTKDTDGYASENLIAVLDAAGIIMDLYTAKNYAVQKGSDAIKKK